MTQTYQRRLLIRVGERALDAFDVGFSIDRSTDYQANNARIQVYNLSADTRRDLQSRARSGIDCEILAGYRGSQEPARLFRGSLRVISSTRQGPDWVTTIESGDGDIVKQSEVNQSWAAGTSLKQVVQDMVGALKASGQDLVKMLAGVPDKPLDGPLVVSGRGDDALAQVLGKLDMEHSWQDGELQVMRKNASLGGTAVLLRADTGMLDSPEVQGVRGFVRVPIVHVRSLLNPLIRPGGLVRVESTAWSGTLTARRVTHTGQSWGGEWETAVEGLVV